MTKPISGISKILMTAAAMAGALPTPALAKDAKPPAPPIIAITDDGQTLLHCINPNTPKESRRIRKITEANIEEILDTCLDAQNFVRSLNILIPSNRGSLNRKFNERGWHVIDQLFAIYDGKIERQTELNALLQKGARNPATGKKWKGRERDQFQAELLEVNGWLSTVNSAVNIQNLKEWRNANAPNVLSITPIVGSKCQTEIRTPANSTLQENFTTCGEWRAPAVGPLHYQFRVTYQSPPQSVAPTPSTQP